MENRNSRYKTNSPTVVYEIIDGEAVIVNMDNGSYYSIDDSGALIWESISRGSSFEDVCNHLSARHLGSSNEIEIAVSELIGKFLEEELLLRDDDSDRVDVPDAITTEEADKVPFKAPELRKYTDMEELLLLDPIHDEGVDEPSS